MQVTWLCLVGLIYFANSVSSTKNDVFTSSFLVRFRRNVDGELAHLIADRNGFENLGPVSDCDTIYRFFFFKIKSISFGKITKRIVY